MRVKGFNFKLKCFLALGILYIGLLKPNTKCKRLIYSYGLRTQLFREIISVELTTLLAKLYYDERYKI